MHTLEFTLSKVPNQALVQPIKRYLTTGNLSGGFLNTLFANDLVGAFNKADLQNQSLLGDWAKFLFNYIPSRAWGSKQAIEEFKGYENQL